MVKIGDLQLKGKSGKNYEFEVYNFNVEFKEAPGIYVITKRNLEKKHTIIYVGETNNMKERHSSHHKENCFIKNNANCKCFLREGNSENRLFIEDDLINYYNPVCNG